jgi:hypothetical protein
MRLTVEGWRFAVRQEKRKAASRWPHVPLLEGDAQACLSSACQLPTVNARPLTLVFEIT